jgi:PIN domain nuclease of toxin-antitoxin system
MKILLDTHVFLWYVMGDQRLSQQAKAMIDAKLDLCFISVSLWEIAIKMNIGKLQLNCTFDDLLLRLSHIQAEILPIQIEDTQAYLNLPLFQNHRDPFDRMLVAQTLARSMDLVSGDTKFDLYSIQRVWT